MHYKCSLQIDNLAQAGQRESCQLRRVLRGGGRKGEFHPPQPAIHSKKISLKSKYVMRRAIGERGVETFAPTPNYAPGQSTRCPTHYAICEGEKKDRRMEGRKDGKIEGLMV